MILQFPEQNYNYICEECGKISAKECIHQQYIGFVCPYCGSEKLDRVIDRKVCLL